MSSAVSTLESPSGLKIYYKGPSLEKGPLPAFFYFALSGEESLTLEPFNQPVSFASHLNMRCFSFTLPFHGKGHQHSHAMSHWAKSLQAGSSMLEDFLDQSIENINFLIDAHLIDKRHIAVGGLSRGGFMATQLAARHEKIDLLIGHAPLIHLPALKEFNEMENSAQIQLFDSMALIPKLLSKKVFFLIGNHDTRVGTTHACTFIQKLAAAMFAGGKRSPPAELYLFPSIGYQGHGTPSEVFQQGITWLQKQWHLR